MNLFVQLPIEELWCPLRAARRAPFPALCVGVGLMACLGLMACSGPQKSATPIEKVSARFALINRADFNRLAVRLNAPIYWVRDTNRDAVVDPDEVVELLFYRGTGPDKPYAPYLSEGAFTPTFVELYSAMIAASAAGGLDALDDGERARRELVLDDLGQGLPTLVLSDFSAASAGEQAFVAKMLEVANLIDGIYAVQTGVAPLAAELPDDLESKSLFRRNRGPRCAGPKTENNPACTAIPGVTVVPSGAYPAELQADPEFCAKLSAREDARTLLDPFVVVRGAGDALSAVPYNEAFAPLTTDTADALEAAAALLEDDASEAPLRAYLRASAKGFRDNDWVAADEAWAAMNATNSKWYVRVGPDETGWDPCSEKAGYHLSFARINPDSLSWQERLAPVQNEMETSVATLIGAPYAAREVSFHLPDFIDIVVNAGDDRNAMGATIGQSLPNWGPVANEGRGRTVAMSNLYTDVDSQGIRRQQAASLFASAAMDAYSDDPAVSLYSTILHEAGHNLGPSAEYAVDGKVDSEIFGGPLAAVLEELKAQTMALWYTELLRGKGIVSDEMAQQGYLDSLTWGMGHIARGMYSPTGKSKPYSQLAAIQLGFLMDKGAVEFVADAPAANGEDVGAFVLHLERFPAAIDEMMLIVGRIKANGEKAKAEELVAAYVEGTLVPHDVIKERMLRFPKQSFIYAVKLTP